jgi:histone-lysine N-methyltransferase SETMAR
MRRVSAKFVPRLLTDDQKENRVEISQELLANANCNENLLKNIITGDETWVCDCDVETKVKSSQWMGKGSPSTENSTDESVKD